MKPRAHPEADLQRAVVAYLTHALPKDVWFTAVNPRPAKTPMTAALSKAMGMKAGVPDLLIIYDGKALFIELKAGRGRLSEAQSSCIDAIHRAGGTVFACRSISEIVSLLTALHVPLRARVAA